MIMHTTDWVDVYYTNIISSQDVSATTTPSAVILTWQCTRPVGGEAEVCVRIVCTTPQGQSVTSVPRATSQTPAAEWTVLMPAFVSNAEIHHGAESATYHTSDGDFRMFLKFEVQTYMIKNVQWYID